MALINCPECSKDVSDQAATCPNCGNPINKDRSTSVTVPNSLVNERFEQRIKEYEANGYKLTRRSSDTVCMFKKTKRANNLMICIYIIFIILILISIVVAQIVYGGSGIFALIFIPFLFLSHLAINTINCVTITLIRTGELEEKGNVLK